MREEEEEQQASSHRNQLYDPEKSVNKLVKEQKGSNSSGSLKTDSDLGEVTPAGGGKSASNVQTTKNANNLLIKP